MDHAWCLLAQVLDLERKGLGDEGAAALAAALVVDHCDATNSARHVQKQKPMTAPVLQRLLLARSSVCLQRECLRYFGHLRF